MVVTKCSERTDRADRADRANWAPKARRQGEDAAWTPEPAGAAAVDAGVASSQPLQSWPRIFPGI